MKMYRIEKYKKYIHTNKTSTSHTTTKPPQHFLSHHRTFTVWPICNTNATYIDCRTTWTMCLYCTQNAPVMRLATDRYAHWTSSCEPNCVKSKLICLNFYIMWRFSLTGAGCWGLNWLCFTNKHGNSIFGLIFPLIWSPLPVGFRPEAKLIKNHLEWPSSHKGRSCDTSPASTGR